MMKILLISLSTGDPKRHFWRNSFTQTLKFRILPCLQEPDVAESLKIQRIKWAGRVIRTNKKETLNTENLFRQADWNKNWESTQHQVG
ncbi:hypothetical protein TNCV_5092411 [Trichonephila clavipes]|nr:hypothetical protein TNCV_5092411 [Trichonephila clavipes]